MYCSGPGPEQTSQTNRQIDGWIDGLIDGQIGGGANVFERQGSHVASYGLTQPAALGRFGYRTK